MTDLKEKLRKFPLVMNPYFITLFQEEIIMSYYPYLASLFGIVWIIFSMIRTKKSGEIVYGKLDKAGVVTNIVLTVVYAFVSPYCLLIGLLCAPAYDGFLGVIGWILSAIASSSILFCGLGIGSSISLRRKGKSKLSFAVQFAGIIGIGIMLLIFFTCYGTLLKELN